ncbi:hypothetical protein IP88_07990 [alpha proteobacterium AAP81b]|nr:hypothetical protein IP88_07990 [alpha proteobacterium AAP81b]
MFRTLAFGAALAAAAPALAQPAADGPTFNGLYAGAQLGWQQDKQTLRLTDNGLESRASNKTDGFSYGGQVGYDFGLSPNFVLGVEGSVTGRTGGTNLDVDTRLSVGRTVNATGRLGYRLDSNSLLYARGGYSNTQFRVSNDIGRVSEDRDGFTVGAGYERYLTRQVSARLEYNYSDYGRDRLPFLADSLGVDRADLGYRRHAVTAGVNFHF